MAAKAPSRKSTRSRKPPAYLADYDTGKPELALDEEDVDPAMNFLMTERQLLVDDIVANKEKILGIIAAGGSRSRAQRLLDRMSRGYDELKNILKQIGEMGNEEERRQSLIESRDWKKVIENVEDDLDTYMESRKDDAPSEVGHLLDMKSAKSGSELDDRKVSPETKPQTQTPYNPAVYSAKATVTETKNLMQVEENSSETEEEMQSDADSQYSDVSVAKSQEAKIKAEVATLKVQQEKKRFELQQQINAAQAKLEISKIEDEAKRAELESRLWKKERNDVMSHLAVPSATCVKDREDDILPRISPPQATRATRRPYPEVDENSIAGGQMVEVGKPVHPLRHIVDSLPRDVKPKKLSYSPVMSSEKPGVDPSDEHKQLQRFFQGIAKPQLPKFDGVKEKYQDWREQFHVFIESASVPVRHKMIMLKNSLSGRPAKLVERLGFTQDQFDMAIFKLDQRYGGENRQLQHYMDTLLSMTKVNADNLESLEDLSNYLCDLVSKLYANGHTSELTGTSALYSLVKERVPNSILLDYLNLRNTEDPDGLAVFSEWLNNQVCIKIEIEESSRKSKPASKPASKSGNQRNKKGKSSSFGVVTQKEKSKESVVIPPVQIQSAESSSKVHSSESATSEFSYSCPLCKESHFIIKCKKWTEAKVPERWRIAKQNKLCYRCLGSGHMGKGCKKDRKCDIKGCTQNHHRHLHGNTPVNGNTEKSGSAFGVSDGIVKPVKVGLRVVPVFIYDVNGQKRKLNAFLDDGSDSSYASRDVVANLGHPIEENSLKLSTLTQESRVPSGMTVLKIENLDGTLSRTIGVRTLDQLCSNLRIPDWQHHKKKWSHLSEIDFPKLPGHKSVDLLIGSDHPELMMALEERSGRVGEPIARLTPLGWTCVGVLDDEVSIYDSTSSTGFHGSVYHATSDRQMDENLRSLWNMDVVTSYETPKLSPEETQALEKAAASRVLHDDRYEIGVTWYDEIPNLPDNYYEAERRLLSLEKSLRQKPALSERVCEGMQQNIDKQYIRFVTDDRSKIPPGWYLPYFPVVREERETTKVRIVLDSASKYKGVSLNDMMHPGPKLQREIFDILVRFRRGRIGLVGDIKEMFSQVILAEKDRRFHRLLYRDMNNTQPIRIYEAQRLTFGDRASPFLAQYVLQSHARDHAERFPRASATCLESIYMDDAIDSVDSTVEGVQLREDLSSLLQGAGFIIRKWASNDPGVLKDVPIEDLAQGMIKVENSEMPSIKTLGLLWNTTTDCFEFSNEIHPPVLFTKRSLLSKVAKLFDPLQFLAPFTIRAKILLQKTWILGLDWDEELPAEVQSAALTWFHELRNITSVTVPRWYFDQSPEKISIHTFSDASSSAYAAVSYVRSIGSDGVVVRQIAAKARVAPLRAVSIPRLELMGAVLGYRLTKKICLLLKCPLGEVTFWTDSMDVIHWVRSQSRTFKAFVANRVSEIQTETLPVQWRYVPGSENPADDATRGLHVSQMMVDHRWFVGPEFLYQEPDEWPQTKLANADVSDAAEVEVAPSRSHAAVSELPSRFICWEKFSTWTRLVRTCVMVLRFIQLLKTPEENRSTCELHRVVDVEEFEKAEMVVVRQVQLEGFRTTIDSLEAGRSTVQSPLRRLSPFLDEHRILRVGGRLHYSNLPFDVRHPMLLPRHHHASELVIRQAHVKVGHSRGINAVMAEVLVRFWIVHGREAIKKMKYRCFRCRRMNDQFLEQIMAPLPSSRSLTSLRAFANIGIDFAGPFITKITRRVSAKRYVCLFTCVQTRGVHLEMVYSLDTDGFLLAFSRMVSRRGKPRKVVCDNGSNLSAGERHLRELIETLDQDRIIESASQQGIDWKFNPPYGSHHGGVFESLIKSTKRGLNATVSSVGLTDEELLTALVEVEGILNSRPLLYCSSDPDDEPVLTPNHFLHGQMGGPLAPYGTEELAYNPRLRWRFVQDLIAQFWRRWTREYLPTLQPRGKWLKEQRDLVVDDVVLVADQKTPRGMWPLGRVTKTFPSPDGHVRSVEVICRGKLYVRPISCLVLIVARDESVVNVDKSSVDVTGESGHGGECTDD